MVKEPDDWTEEELHRIGSKRIDNLIEEKNELLRLWLGKTEESSKLEGERQKGIDTLTPEEYENLGIQIQKLDDEAFELSEHKKEKYEELGRIASLNYAKLDRNRKKYTYEQKRRELTSYLDEIRNIPIKPGNLVDIIKKLDEMKSEFFPKLGEVRRCARLYDTSIKPDQEFRGLLETIWNDKVSQFRQVMIERKKQKGWEHEFRSVSKGKVCKYVTLELNRRQPYTCILTGDSCVATVSYRELELEFEITDCPAYNIQRNLASKLQRANLQRKKRSLDSEYFACLVSIFEAYRLELFPKIS